MTAIIYSSGDISISRPPIIACVSIARYYKIKKKNLDSKKKNKKNQILQPSMYIFIIENEIFF